MKIIFASIIFLLLSFELSAQEYQPRTIVIKFSQDAEQTTKIRSGEITEIEQFRQLLGNHQLKSFVNIALLKNLEKRKNDNQLLGNRTNQGLDRIFVIEYSNNIDSKTASRKISSFDFIEYAEPKYINRIFEDSLPNDSLINSQYYLKSIQAIESWAHIDTSGRHVVVGVVDTGVDYKHEDLIGTMQINSGEDGTDNSGNEKRSNGIDDDMNGFIDDWMGWDFASNSSESGFDNDPFPGHPHGTHVSGIIAAVKNNLVGIAGIGLNTKILPVKIGNDGQFSRNLVNSYDGLLYAAIAGANIINCSWGSGGYSQSEQDVINEVINLGALIVAAAGNERSQIAFYPASYNGVISVAAIDSQDRKAGFSNFYSTVDISAPGEQIISSIPINDYAFWDGTSMASPVAAAVAGMIWLNHPEYNNIQIGEHLKATSKDINEENPGYNGLIGSGKVDALNAATEINPVSISLKNYVITQEIEDGVITSGEIVNIKLELFNALKPAKDVNIYAMSPAFYQPEFITSSLSAGDFGTYETKAVNGTISFRVNQEKILNYSLPITIIIIDEAGHRFTNTISLFINPTWRTMRSNNIQLTYTSQGNLAYDDFPYNSRGEGFSFKKGTNLLFEGALMIGYGYNSIANSARSSNASSKDSDFNLDKPIESFIPGSIAAEETITEFVTKEDSLLKPARIIQSGYQFKGSSKDDIIYVVYDIINETDSFQDSVYAAIYLDWDIGPSGSNNRAIWNKSGNFAYIINIADDSLPKAGMKMLSSHPVNFWAVDNDGVSEENPGVYNGFSKEEKWRMMTSGIGRDSSNSTDVSVVIGAGPIRLRAGDTTRVAFALFAGNSLDDLQKFSEDINLSDNFINPDGSYSSNPKISAINLIFPNPAQNTAVVELAVSDINSGELSLWDVSGKKLKDLFIYDSQNQNKLYPGYLRLEIDLRDLSQGQYFIRFKTDKDVSSQVLNIIR